MIIKKTRITNLDRYLGFIKEGKDIVVGCKIEHIPEITLEKMGFPKKPSLGQTVLPAPSFGPISSYNAEGKVEVHRDQPMETAYRQVEWHWTEWRGRYDSEDQYRIVDVPYKRYPRTFISPPSIELTVSKLASGETALVAEPIKLVSSNKEIILHMVNLFLEIIGQSEIFSENLEGVFKVPLKRLNWEILPPGKYPWQQIKPRVDELVKSIPKGNQVVIEHRVKEINKYSPTILAIGQAGFRGYMIFGFPVKNLYVLESLYFGNATYVFTQDWEDLSKRTKAEILEASLQKDRIIHREGWDDKIYKLLK